MQQFHFDSFIAYASNLIYKNHPVVWILCNGSAAWSRDATMAQVIATEQVGVGGYTRQTATPTTINFNALTRQALTEQLNESFAASGANIPWDAAVLLQDAATQTGQLISAVDVAGNELTANSAHNLTNLDPVMVTVDSGGSAIGGTDETSIYTAVVTGASTFKLSSTTDGSTIVDLTNAGSVGTIATRLRYAKGRLMTCFKPDSPQVITNGGSQPIPVQLGGSNPTFISA
jgi:hypothetical protein